MSLTREQILAARNLAREKVTVPEWGGDVWVQVMSGTERDAYEVSMARDFKNGGTPANMRASLVVRCLVDESGNKLFKPEDAEELGRDSCIPIDRLAQVAQRINKLSDKEMESAKGNSEPSPGDAPSSASP